MGLGLVLAFVVYIPGVGPVPVSWIAPFLALVLRQVSDLECLGLGFPPPLFALLLLLVSFLLGTRSEPIN
jgi:hypothetical protein